MSDACTTLPLAENHKRIWLQPICQVDERCWCEDPQPCDDCGLPAIKYIRADLAEAEIERLRAALKEIVNLGHEADLPDAWKIARASLSSTPESPT